MSTRYVMQRDTGAWRLQVWAAFVLALIACAVGTWELPGQQLDRAFVAIGLFFSLFACLAVAKTQRDNRDGQVDTQGWVLTVWVGFAAAMVLTGWGLWRMSIDTWHKNYMVVSWLFLVSSAFTVAKTARDRHEADLMARAASQAREQAQRPTA